MVCCDLCRTAITATPDGSLRYFASHRGSNKCIHAQQNLQQQINQGQILDLVFDNSDWIWTGQYIHFGAQADDDPSTSQHYVIQVLGALIYPIAPDLKTPDDLSEDGQNHRTCI
jgi:hypothetical protein